MVEFHSCLFRDGPILENHAPVELEVFVFMEGDAMLCRVLNVHHEEEKGREHALSQPGRAEALGIDDQGVSAGRAGSHSELEQCCGGSVAKAEHVAFIWAVREDPKGLGVSHDHAICGNERERAMPDWGGRVDYLKVGERGPMLEVEQTLRGLNVEHALLERKGCECERVEQLNDGQHL